MPKRRDKENAAEGAEKPAEQEKHEAVAQATPDTPERRLREIKTARPAGLIFFVAFIAFNAWVIAFTNPCKVSNKVDCGWSGVSQATCLGMGAFFADNEREEVKIAVKRNAGDKLGLKIQMARENEWAIVTEISDGAVAVHNDAASGDASRVRQGDRIVKVDGQRGKGITQALKSTKSQKVDLTVARPSAGSAATRIPGAFWGLLGKHAPSVAGVLLTAGSSRFAEVLVTTSGVGVLLWRLSGFPAASLPLYYFGTSALVAWWNSGACYDDHPKTPGAPHCYCSANLRYPEVLSKAWARTTQKQFRKLVGM